MSELKKAERLKETIKQAFEANENETELLVTADGNCFCLKTKTLQNYTLVVPCKN